MFGLSRSQQSVSHCSLFYEGSTSIDDGITKNLFADFFSEVFGDDDYGNLDPTTPPFSPDSIPPAEVRYCCDLLIKPLTALFNKYKTLNLSSGIFPSSVLKKSFIVPIHKKGMILKGLPPYSRSISFI